MFVLAIRYLNGWSMAAEDGARKEQAEWPPHPDRVFMALAAAWFETGEEGEEAQALRWLEEPEATQGEPVTPHGKEGEALLWLQALPPPAVAASDAAYRTIVTSYVPVNDDGGGKKSSPKTELDRLRNKGLALMPEHRLRQPRGFPVAIPHDPTVRLIWRETEPGDHHAALERLAAKVTHVGHSASFVQVWVERDCDIAADWEPVEGIATRRLRVPSAGSLERLARPYRDAKAAFRDHLDKIEQAETELKALTPPPRVAWQHDFPDAVLLAAETRTKRHPEYAAAKSGDDSAAAKLVDSLVDGSGLTAVRRIVETSRSGAPVLVCAHAYEREGVNAIPVALSELLSQRLDVALSTAVVQSNVVSHTGADGYGRLARQARFEGDVAAGREYLMVDDFIGQGGTLANLRGWIEKQDGRIIGAVGLTGKPYSAKLNPSREQLDELRQKHGRDFEKWWRGHFGHAFNCLTQSEARYLARSPDADTIRDRLAAAEREGDRRGSARSVKEQKQHIRRLKSQKLPVPLRPVPGTWQGYDRPLQTKPEPAPHSIFDPRVLVLGIGGRRVSLPATLKLASALRGLLMRECPEQPPPEWFSGHRPDGIPTLAPLPFVGSHHADGRIMGLALVLPGGWTLGRQGAAWSPSCAVPKPVCRANTGCSMATGSSAPSSSTPASDPRRTSTRAPGRPRPASGPA